MTRAKSPVPVTERIHPDFFYRRHSPTAKAVIGLGDTAIGEAIKAGKLDPPVPAFEGSKALGWVGQTLIDLQNRRRERARAVAEHLATKSEM
jgi:hypothetical protein